jgi:hypothetical protein
MQCVVNNAVLLQVPGATAAAGTHHVKPPAAAAPVAAATATQEGTLQDEQTLKAGSSSTSNAAPQAAWQLALAKGDPVVIPLIAPATAALRESLAATRQQPTALLGTATAGGSGE